jgi:hypothetical protein
MISVSYLASQPIALGYAAGAQQHLDLPARQVNQRDALRPWLDGVERLAIRAGLDRVLLSRV